ncbi:FMN-dependent NADH-azoreductase [Filimonas lacunae]|uniref:FMN dependent NADH:quinone oxidoreductase n=1 Tax=Filimonas lacunae TaxID=477680 RepID=A0A173M958_9BACT|nr:NAD(P)H-dependent oxidoreductase [Filimonas lacunae]BAV04077.1 FMN-dependent NADH-azoreductase [Filimonas lacunae]SIT15697.1 FMN-dependent NADH-azoreductase [Filimonas lacunae]
MKKVLHLISSPRTEASVSRQLGSVVIGKLLEKYPGSSLKVRDLAASPVPHLDEIHIQSFFTPVENRSPEQEKAIRYSEEAIAELQEADLVIVEAPMYNFTIPSTLKAYFDHIARAGITFRYVGNGHLPEGLLKNKEAYIITSSGGIYSEGVLKPYDFVEPYLRFFLNLVGIKVIDVFRAEGQAAVGAEAALQKGVEGVVVL